MQKVDIVKWVATVIQLIGYALTGLNYTPLNVYFFLVGIFFMVLCRSDVEGQSYHGCTCRSFFIIAYRIFKCVIVKY